MYTYIHIYINTINHREFAVIYTAQRMKPHLNQGYWPSDFSRATAAPNKNCRRHVSLSESTTQKGGLMGFVLVVAYLHAHVTAMFGQP